MSSGFNIKSSSEPTGRWMEIKSIHPGRYRFFKTRMYGRLHFVKALSEESKGDLISIEALRKEFDIGYNLDHPNIARYLKFEDDAIFEEYIDGKSLRQMLDEKDESLNDKKFIANVCHQLLDAVSYLHSKGVLHLDIKPENVMITRVGNQVKIIDFGCAYIASDDTTQGFTLQYKAPEQGISETNAYTDIYLIGKTVSELADYAECLPMWKKFVAKATAGKPTHRFLTEAEAIKAIPVDKPMSVGVACAVITAAVIGCLFLLCHHPEGSGQQSIAEVVGNEVVQPTDTITPSTQLVKEVEVPPKVEEPKPQRYH